MKVRGCAGLALAVFGALTVGCASSATSAPSASDASSPPLARAEAGLAAPGAVEATWASSLAGVARWEVHGTSGSLDAVVEGMDAQGKQVVLLSVAYPEPSSAGSAAVAYSVDPALAFPFEAVRAAVRRDVTSGSSLAPKSLGILDDGAGGQLVSSGNSLVCNGSFGVALLAGACTVLGCLGAAVSIGGTLPFCFGCAVATGAAVGGGAAAGCKQGDLPDPSDVPTG